MNMDNNDILNIEILGEIGGWGFTFSDLYAQAKGFSGRKIRVPVNSFGGQVFEALLIYNYLKGSGKEIETHIPTYAMSAGTIIASAGEKVTMSENGYYMIHNPFSFGFGDANEMQNTADLLAKMTNDLISIYVAKTGLPEEEIREMMDKETWLNSKEALELGFVDELTAGAKIEASFDPKQFESFSNVPQDIQNLFEEPKQEKPEKPQTNSFLSALAQIFNSNKTDLSNYIEQKEHEATIEQMKNEFAEREADLIAQHKKDLSEKDALIESAQKEIEALKNTPIEAETNFETSPANTGTNNNFFMSFDKQVMAQYNKKNRQ